MRACLVEYPGLVPTSACGDKVMHTGVFNLHLFAADIAIEGPVLLDAFCTIEDNWIKYSPPFDHVVIQGDETRVIGTEGALFIARPVS